MRTTRSRLAVTVLALTLLIPEGALAEPFEQEFLVTAYYSPEPHQCCYVTGALAGDLTLNGEGVRAADETPVYAGMAAAPVHYPFGTRITLPGIGTFTVHDRGGAIRALRSGMHRLDLWVGHGEEGLARALAFGVQEVRGVVYPLGSAQPPESFALTSLPASLELLRNYLAHEPDLLALRPRLGEKTLRAQILQEHLRDAGYFSGKLTGLFGEVTHGSLARFMREFGLQGSGEELTEEVAAYLVAAVRRRSVPEPVSTIVEQGSPRETILRAQRTLRFLGAYRGRTHGVYDARFEEAVQKFQKGQGIISADEDPGAGRIGPRTREAIRKLWQRTHVAREARQVLFERKINTLLVEGGKVPGEFLAKGDRGTHVIRLQKLLADRGFFPKERISGLFGDVTHEAVLKYQFARGIIQNPEERGAGTVGPATIAEFYREEREKLYHLVRSQGWFVL